MVFDRRQIDLNIFLSLCKIPVPVFDTFAKNSGEAEVGVS